MGALRRNRPAPRWRIPVLALLALMAGACVNPFKPADPEPPDADGVVEDFRTPEDVLNTIAAALQNRTTNGANAYLHAFAESTLAGDRAFRAHYDGGVKSTWQSANSQSAPEPWDLSLERNLHSSISVIAPPADVYLFQWEEDPDSPNDETPADSDTALFHRHYTLFAVPLEGNPRKIAIGLADLSFQNKDGRWSIFRWVDRVDPDVGVNPVDPDQRTMSWLRLESITN